MYRTMKKLLLICVVGLITAFPLFAEEKKEVSLRYSQRDSIMRVVLQSDDNFIKSANVIATLSSVKFEFPATFELKKQKDFIFDTSVRDRFLTISLKNVEDIKTYKLTSPARLVIDIKLTQKALKEQMAPNERQSVPIEKKPAPTEKKAEPVEKKVVPTEKKPEPTEKKPEPVEKKPAPTEKKAEPVEKKVVPTEKKPEPTEKKPEPAEKKPAPTEKKPEPTEKKPEVKQEQKHLQEQPVPKPAAPKIVFLDAGHGGYDYGLISKDAKEKDIDLLLAKDLNAAIAKKGDKVFLTRKVDQSLSISERIMAANSRKPDIFISIHSSNSNAFVIYTAAVDDQATEASVKLYGLAAKQGRHIDKSRLLAKAIGGFLKDAFKGDVFTGELPLPVLNSMDAAAVLIEYPSLQMNSYDQKMRDLLVNALVKGIRSYE
jgi:N-acetylmuramoyl-L-alanine amidase